MNSTTLIRSCTNLAVLVLSLLGSAAMIRADEPSRLEVREWSLWVTEPHRNQFNTADVYLNGMPGIVDSSRSSRPGAKRVAVTPLSMITFSGKIPETTDVTLKITAGRFISHWPAAEVKNNRLRWLDLKLSDKPASEAFAVIPEGHWFNQARKLESLFLKRGERPERFLCYDTELPGEMTARVEGGPEKYKIVNKGTFPIYDVLLIAPTSEGRRFGWLKEVAAAVQPPAQPKKEKQPEKKPDADEKDKPADAPEATAPAAAPVAAAPVAPAAPAAAPAATEASGAKAAPDGATKPAAQPAATAVKETTVEIELTPPLDDKQLADQAGGSLRSALTAAGLTEGEINLLLEIYNNALFGCDEMVLVYRMPQAKLDELLPLEVDPETAKITRVGLVLCQKVDPKINDQIKELAAQLSDASYAQREKAEERLKELGRIAIPRLKELLKGEDAEAAMRAERLLLQLNEPLDGK
jgi:hypothetical protein